MRNLDDESYSIFDKSSRFWMLDHLVIAFNYILVWLFFIHEDLWESLEMDKESYTQVFAPNWVNINGF